MKGLRDSLLLVSCAVALGGCTMEWSTEAQVPRQVHAAERPDPARQRLQRDRAKLEQRLTTLQDRLAQSGVPTQAERDLHLALTLALIRLDQALEAGGEPSTAVSGELQQSSDRLDALLATARQRLAAARRERSAPGGSSRDIVYRQRTVFDFDDDIIDGNLVRPDGQWKDAGKRPKHKHDPTTVLPAPPPPKPAESAPLFEWGEHEGKVDPSDDLGGFDFGNDRWRDPRKGVEGARVRVAKPRRALLQQVRRQARLLERCLPPGLLGRQSGLRLRVNAQLSASGHFSQTRLAGARALTPRARACIVDALQAMRVPAQAGGQSNVVSFTLRLGR